MRSRLCPKLTALILTMMLMGSMALVWQARSPVSRAQRALSAGGLSLSPTKRTTYPGGTFRLDITVDCGANADAAAVVVTFAPSHLQVTRVVSDATQFPSVLSLAYDNVSGRVRYEAGAALTCHRNGDCPSGLAQMASITFRAVGGSVATTELGVRGLVAWQGLPIFEGEGSGSTVAITLAGDMDGDCDVDVVDIMLVAGRWASVAGDANYDSRYDCDMDGDIDIVDIMFVAGRWSQSCAGVP